MPDLPKHLDRYVARIFEATGFRPDFRFVGACLSNKYRIGKAVRKLPEYDTLFTITEGRLFTKKNVKGRFGSILDARRFIELRHLVNQWFVRVTVP